MTRVVRRTTLLCAIGLIGTGVGAAGSLPAAAASQHAGSVGSGFGSLSITATAAAVRAPFYSSQGEDVEGELPYAESELSSGLSGRSLTSVFWPGDTGGNGGSTLYLLGPQCVPPNPNNLLPVPCVTTLPQGPQSLYNQLNDPEVAKAQTGTGNATNENDTPYASQRAVAHPTLLTADTVVEPAKVPKVSETFGATSAGTKIAISGLKTAVVTATSVAHDISLAGGLIKLGSVSSTASATSNTLRGTGKAATTVSDATIAGVPVSIDNTGVHLKGSRHALPATSPVNKALTQAGIQIFIAQPTKTIKRANVSVDSGSVIVLFNQSQYVKNANDTGSLLILGGASITANTTKGYLAPPVKVPVPAASTPAASGGGGGASSTGGGSAAGGATGGSLPAGSTSSGGGGQAPVVASQPVKAADALPLPHGLQLAWLILGLVFAGAVGYGLKRLPDRLLEAPATTCPLEDQG